MRLPDRSVWRDRRVLVTGHMGFKGAWLSCVLSQLGAVTTGFGYDHRRPLTYESLTIPNHTHVEGDVTDGAALAAVLQSSQAEVVFHLAAQPIVITSYEQPLATFRDNIMGVAEVLEAVRRAPSVRAVVIVTSDKVYHNNELGWAYRENEPLGGHDPYSASKAAAEIVAKSMIDCFFTSPSAARVATARAGNVIGGGDWAEHRLLPDAARAISAGAPLVVRNPYSTRPWQHVLEPLSGYLVLAESLLVREHGEQTAWNFGPVIEDALPVGAVADLFVKAWGEGAQWRLDGDPEPGLKEAGFLAVDASLARRKLNWAPRWRVSEAVARTAQWYRGLAHGKDPNAMITDDITAYFETAGKMNA